ncbi:PDZ domain-containing protein [Muricauda sp. JGD-17]|uniref:PDZ domain-containing protein n=1 Tax=Flagellimonas ochracea TaxID=2696472 RepID=A0A964TBK6_9FLAO|nr:alpha/beta hydrolase [Allomuricauda ochracea]NAY91850.1 PDZ domain-containing protein [Allomuricauda ochracea]
MKLKNKSLLTGVLFILVLLPMHSQMLGRRCSWEATINSPTTERPGAEIIKINPKSVLEEAGFQTGDIIIEVDGRLIKDDEVWTDVSYGLRANNPTRIVALRGANRVEAIVELKPRPKETHDGLDTFYEEVTSPYGITQRTIITRPKKAGKQPAIVLIGGLSCSSIETYPGRSGNWVQTIKDLVEKSGMVVMRIEKPGVGDSDGDCGSSDFLTDLEGYRAAIKSLKSKPYVDTSKIVAYGSSMGSALAPMLANEFNLAGVISDGTFFKTWFEHMLEIERRILQFQGNTESEIVEKMNKYYFPLYYGMLIEKKTYQEVVDAYPALAEYNYHAPAHMYGRPVAYYQQLQDIDLAGQWEKIKVPIRILRGEHDWIMSAFDNHMIIEVLKRNGHNDHILYEYPGLDHWNTIHESPKNSFEGKPGKWDEGTINLIIKWAQDIVGLNN